MDVLQPKVVLSALGEDIPVSYFSATDKLKLFVNDIEIGADTTIADLEECTAVGYAAQTLGETWLSGIDPATGLAIIKYPENVSFSGLTADPPETVFGWYVTDATDLILKLAGQLDTPITLDDVERLIGVLVWFLLSATSSEHQEAIETP